MKSQQSEGNLALTDESREGLHQPLPRPPGRGEDAAENILEDASDRDSLAPAQGMIAGFGVSLLLWCLAIFLIYWIGFS